MTHGLNFSQVNQTLPNSFMKQLKHVPKVLIVTLLVKKNGATKQQHSINFDVNDVNLWIPIHVPLMSHDRIVNNALGSVNVTKWSWEM